MLKYAISEICNLEKIIFNALYFSCNKIVAFAKAIKSSRKIGQPPTFNFACLWQIMTLTFETEQSCHNIVALINRQKWPRNVNLFKKIWQMEMIWLTAI